MDRRAVERYMPLADEAIQSMFGNTKVDKTYRSKLSAFGAAVIMSGLLPTIAYYSKNEDKIIKLLEYMYNNSSETKGEKKDSLFDYVKTLEGKELSNIKEKIINYSISLKLVLNLYI